LAFTERIVLLLAKLAALLAEPPAALRFAAELVVAIRLREAGALVLRADARPFLTELPATFAILIARLAVLLIALKRLAVALAILSITIAVLLIAFAILLIALLILTIAILVLVVLFVALPILLLALPFLLLALSFLLVVLLLVLRGVLIAGLVGRLLLFLGQGGADRKGSKRQATDAACPYPRF
jgi:hypothetical protein